LTKDYKQKTKDHTAISLTRKSDLEQYILEGRSLAEKMFGFDTPLKVDEENKTEAGHYDFRSDTAYVHVKFFQKMNKKYADIDLKKLVEHTVCHEIGHAFDARQFALRGIFPYVVKIGRAHV
jgi:predicted Zn-dependent protease with MMP-like domain